MRKFTPDELHLFLESLDRHLRRPVRMNIMGGGVLALAYHVDWNTDDIDTFETNLSPLKTAIKKAHEETDLDVVVSAAGGAVGDVPYNSDERLIHIMPELEKLKIYSLEAHDVTLSKTLRGQRKDYEAIEKLHDHVGLSESVLIDRYMNEMGHVVGNQERMDDNFAALIDRLYGTADAHEVNRKLRARRSR